jgi:phosphoribosylformimino-5-aminoimidazole carboxamide ribotide isomerase
VLTGQGKNEAATLLVIPAVDLLGSEAVRLRRGDYRHVTNRRADPVALIESYAEAGAELIHVVDLDGARDGLVRPDVMRRAALAAAPARIQASGGIRSVGDAERLLEAGARRVVVGTAAFAADDALDRFVEALGDRLVVAVDVRDGRVAVGGWTRTTTVTAEEAIERCSAAGASRALCTAIDRDGTLDGPDVGLLERVCSGREVAVLAAGGIRSHDDLAAVARAGCEGAIVGRALLEGRLPLSVLAADATLNMSSASAVRAAQDRSA